MTPLRLMPRRFPILSSNKRYSYLIIRPNFSSLKCYSDTSSKGINANTVSGDSQKPDTKPSEEAKPKRKTQAELDAELMEKLQGLDSEGGAAGVEYEDGKPASMKRSVRNNMFRFDFHEGRRISGLENTEKITTSKADYEALKIGYHCCIPSLEYIKS